MSKSDIYTKEEDKRFTLRINREIFKLLEESAIKDKRSVGKQIEYIMEKYFENNKIK